MDGSIRQRYFRALCRVKNPEFDSKNPHYGNEFASLPSTLRAIRKACEPEGLAYWHRIKLLDSGDTVLLSGITSEDGEELCLSITPMTNNPDSQKFGSELTYKRRQTGQADWGITGEADDDAEAAGGGRDYSAINPLKRRYMAATGLGETEASQQLVKELGNPARLNDEEYRRYLHDLANVVKAAEAWKVKNG